MFKKEPKPTLLVEIRSRLMEASTYAGLSALCLVVVTEFSQNQIVHDMALCAAILAALGAIARSENNIKLAKEVDCATQLLPTLTKTILSIDGALSGNIKHQP